MPNELLDTLKKLVKLQQKDTLIDALRQKISNSPKEIEDLKAKLSESKLATETESHDYKKAVVKHKELETELKAKESEIEKHQKELNEIKSNEAFKALEKEIEFAKKQKDEIETEILNKLEEIESLQKSQKDVSVEFKSEEEKSNAKILEIEKETNQAEKDIAELETQKKEIESEMKPEVLKKYNYIRKKNRDFAVTPVKQHNDGKLACTGCNMFITSQISMELKKKGKLVHCDNCQRIIYMKEDVL
ncbi:MAG TPA: C4-type zinc ribbon domain-containing protein [Elusimicrobiales bacterium]|nr:C4-type zinc ribbon domain-containing protein [Elusimicrobiales bacterium]